MSQFETVSKEDAFLKRTERILIIDDDEAVGATVRMLLEAEGYDARHVLTASEGVEQARHGAFELVITDLRIGAASGLEVIRAIKETDASMPIILMTSYSSLESAVAALRLGAIDYIIKPFDNGEFVHAVARALDERRLRRENAILKRNLKRVYLHKPIIGESVEIKRVLDLIRRVAPSDANVLIHGESGTGKELVAQAIHYEGPRSSGPFVAVNCGAIPAELMESELFGHARGAYTGATSASEGLIREAHGGTLFLDEVSELSPALQVKFLRVLQDRQVRAVGAKEVVRVDVRFVAASNRDLKGAIDKGQFRDDLFYRLNVINIRVPPLRERGRDVEILAKHFIEEYAAKLRKHIRGVDRNFDQFLASYHWPGNVRELENLIERAVILADSDTLSERDFTDESAAAPTRVASTSAPEFPLSVERYIQQVVLQHQDRCSELELAGMLGIGRKALWVRRRRWGLTRRAGIGNERKD